MKVGKPTENLLSARVAVNLVFMPDNVLVM